MTYIADVSNFLDRIAPRILAESWDNVGLLIGARDRSVARVLTCLTLTSDVAQEAVARGVDLIVSHHPVLFRPVQKITSDSREGDLLLRLIEHKIAVLSPHTCYDSAADGINQQLARLFSLKDVRPIRLLNSTVDSAAPDDTPPLGSGRWGTFTPRPLSEFLTQVRDRLHVPHLAFVGSPDKTVRTVAIACGSAAEFLADARKLGCDVLVTGEARFHSALEARESGIALILTGHFQSERPGVEELARILAAEFPTLEVWPSQAETDPIQWL